MSSNDNAAELAREAALWAEYAAPLSSLREKLRTEFEAQMLEEEWTPLAVFALAGLRLVLTVPPGASFPLLLEQGEGAPQSWSCVLDFAAEAAGSAGSAHTRADPAEVEFILGDVVIDPAGAFLAYTVDTQGADRFTVRVRELDGGGPSWAATGSAAPSLAWDTTGDRVLYLAVTQHLQPAELRALSPVTRQDELLQTWETEHGEYIELFTGSDGEQVLAAKELHSHRSIWRLDSSGGRLVPLLDARDGVRVQADARGRLCAVIVSDGQSPDTLLTCGLDVLPVPESGWRTVYRAEPGLHLEDLTLSDHHIEVIVRQGGGQRLMRLGLADGSQQDIVFSDDDDDADDAGPELSVIQLVGGLRTAGGAVDIVRSSWRSPSRWYHLDVDGAKAWPTCQPDEPAGPARLGGDGSRARVTVLHLEAESPDGTRIPLTVLRPPGRTGPLPTILYAYGAYGLAVEAAYSIFRPSLFRRGVAFAVAHVRGGGEHGTAWHEAGRGPGKLKAVEDYLACVRRLTEEHLTPPGGVVARARSAGAAVVGAAVNREPTSFIAGVLEVPFVDCLATLLNPDDPLAELEWDEWGNPIKDAAARDALAALSPVDNVVPGHYPALLLTAGLSDVRVQVTEPLRFAAAVRAASTSNRPVLVRAQEFGHLGPSDATDDRRGEAEILAFVLREVGRTPTGIAATLAPLPES